VDDLSKSVTLSKVLRLFYIFFLEQIQFFSHFISDISITSTGITGLFFFCYILRNLAKDITKVAISFVDKGK